MRVGGGAWLRVVGQPVVSGSGDTRMRWRRSCWELLGKLANLLGLLLTSLRLARARQRRLVLAANLEFLVMMLQ
jgi:hypothetical protein